MPSRSGRPCRKCGVLTTATYCPTHAQQGNAKPFYDRRRGSAASRGYDGLWQKVRKRALERDNYLCQDCLLEDKVTPATEVDHVISLANGGDRLKLSNLRSLCKTHHSQKTAREDGSFGRRRKLL